VLVIVSTSERNVRCNVLEIDWWIQYIAIGIGYQEYFLEVFSMTWILTEFCSEYRYLLINCQRSKTQLIGDLIQDRWSKPLISCQSFFFLFFLHLFGFFYYLNAQIIHCVKISVTRPRKKKQKKRNLHSDVSNFNVALFFKLFTPNNDVIEPMSFW